MTIGLAVWTHGMGASAEARTWYVDEAGTGDAPTIGAAMDSAAYGDTVLVGPGTYWTNCVAMADGVTLKSELGPEVTFLTGGSACIIFGPNISGLLEGFAITPPFDWGVSCPGANGFVIRGNVFSGAGDGGIFCQNAFGEIDGNTVVDNPY